MKLSAVLLCGGESRRMGRDKALLEWDGRPMWQWQLDKLRRLRPEHVYVSARNKPAWLPSDAELILDAPPALGPLSGFAATLARMTTEHLLALAIDLPRMTTDHLQFLCSQLHSGIGVVPIIGDRFEPMAAVYPKESAPYFATALGRRSAELQSIAQELVAAGFLRTMLVPENETALYHNANTPAEWEQK
ncbi:MAG: molybdenum cofactor guanylyltransferase [Verrucomicrobiota bacterium]